MNSPSAPALGIADWRMVGFLRSHASFIRAWEHNRFYGFAVLWYCRDACKRFSDLVVLAKGAFWVLREQFTLRRPPIPVQNSHLFHLPAPVGRSFGQEETVAEQKISTNERLLLIEAATHQCLLVGRNSARAAGGVLSKPSLLYAVHQSLVRNSSCRPETPSNSAPK